MTVNKLSDRESEYHKMVDGTVSDYNSVNRKLQLFRQELACKTQECFEQQEQITRLLAQLVDAQREKKGVETSREPFRYAASICCSAGLQSLKTRHLLSAASSAVAILRR